MNTLDIKNRSGNIVSNLDYWNEILKSPTQIAKRDELVIGNKISFKGLSYFLYLAYTNNDSIGIYQKSLEIFNRVEYTLKKYPDNIIIEADLSRLMREEKSILNMISEANIIGMRDPYTGDTDCTIYDNDGRVNTNIRHLFDTDIRYFLFKFDMLSDDGESRISMSAYPEYIDIEENKIRFSIVDARRDKKWIWKV